VEKEGGETNTSAIREAMSRTGERARKVVRAGARGANLRTREGEREKGEEERRFESRNPTRKAHLAMDEERTSYRESIFLHHQVLIVNTKIRNDRVRLLAAVAVEAEVEVEVEVKARREGRLSKREELRRIRKVDDPNRDLGLEVLPNQDRVRVLHPVHALDRGHLRKLEINQLLEAEVVQGAALGHLVDRHRDRDREAPHVQKAHLGHRPQLDRSARVRLIRHPVRIMTTMAKRETKVNRIKRTFSKRSGFNKAILCF